MEGQDKAKRTQKDYNDYRDELREQIIEGKSVGDITKSFGISNATLTSWQNRLMIEDKKIYEIKSKRGLINKRTVKKGGVSVSYNHLKRAGFTEGDKLEIAVEEGVVQLVKKID